MNLYHEIKDHKFKDMSAKTIVDRIVRNRAAYEARQKMKGEKGVGEAEARRMEEEEAEKMRRIRERKAEELAAKDEAGAAKAEMVEVKSEFQY